MVPIRYQQLLKVPQSNCYQFGPNWARHKIAETTKRKVYCDQTAWVGRLRDGIPQQAMIFFS